MSAGSVARTPAIVLGLFGMLVTLILSGAAYPRGVAVTDAMRCQGLPEPANAAAFIQAQRDQDVEKSSLVTSPLFRAELERRGRDTEWPLLGLWVEAAPLLDYSYLGAVRDDDGFTYALYSARPRQASGSDSPTSLWRIDLDPKGKVIWGEVARILDKPSARVFCTSDPELQAGLAALALSRLVYVPEPSWAVSSPLGQSQVVLGIRSAAGDTYLALRPDPEHPGHIAFAQQDPSGELGPSYWSFGQPTPTRDAEGHSVEPRSFDLGRLTAADVLILQAYLGVLDWSPDEVDTAR